MRNSLFHAKKSQRAKEFFHILNFATLNLLMDRRKFISTTVKAISIVCAGQTLMANPRTFRMPASGKVRLRFAVASDGHYGQPNTDFDQFHLDVVNWLNEENKTRGLAFTVFNGDVIHDDPTLLSGVKEKFDRLDVPYHVSRGNHDRVTADEWQGTWGNPLDHSFTVDDVACLVLDTSNQKGDYLCPDPDLTGSLFKSHSAAAGMFVFMHITPRNWTENGVQCSRLTKTFARQKNLRAIFHGHDHDQDNMKVFRGKPYFFDGHFGGNWGVAYRGYRIVEVLKDGTVVSYQMNADSPQQVNSFRSNHS